MAGFGDFIGRAGSSAEQLFVWQVLGQVISSLTLPYQQALQQAMLELDPNTPLSPAEAASLVARGLLDQGAGADSAAKAGIDGGVFGHLVDAARSGPDFGAVVEAYQRGLIPRGSDDGEQLSLFGGLTDAGIRPDWHPILEKLTTQIPTVAEVMNAWLEGQIDEGEARRRYDQAGGDPTWFQTSYNANGQAPTPSEALELANRGLIPWEGQGPGVVSFRQAFLEGPWRNKWEPVFRALGEYLPPPRTVTAMYHAGQISHDLAAQLLMKQGLSAELAAAYLAPAHHATATATEKHLAKSEVLTLYVDKIMTRTQALTALEALHYSAHDAALLIDLAQLKETTTQLRAGVTRVRSLFQSGKLDTAQARAALHELGIGATEARDLTDTWSVTQATKVKELTAAQIEAAQHYSLISEAEAMSRLEALGYDAADAWLALAVRNHAPLLTIPRPADLGAPPPPPGSPVPPTS